MRQTVSLIGVVLTFFFLWWVYKPKVQEILLPPFHPRPIGLKHIFVIFISLCTIGIWCASSASAVKSFFGDVGIVALIPVGFFYGSGLLTKQDFQQVPWEVLILMGGGMALGFAITSSRLLAYMSAALAGMVGSSLYVSVLVFGTFVWIVSNFVSHTAAAAIIMPVVASVGFTIGHTQIMTLLPVMLDSAACALPISGFPNTITFAQKNHDGDRYVTFRDYLKTGIPVGIMMLVLVNSLGYGLAVALGM